MKPNKAAFDRVCKDLIDGQQLTFRMLGDVFGPDFYELLIFSFLDSQDAARAIQVAAMRLSGRQVEEEETDEEDVN